MSKQADYNPSSTSYIPLFHPCLHYLTTLQTASIQPPLNQEAILSDIMETVGSKFKSPKSTSVHRLG